MKAWQWFWDNKLVTIVVPSLLAGVSYVGILLLDTAFEKGVNQERNKNLEKYEIALQQNNEVLIELITLRIRCTHCCPE